MGAQKLCYPKTVKDFRKDFSSDEACIEYLIKSRWPEGFCCFRCGHHAYWYKPGRKLLVCRSCRHECSPTAGTVMHRSHLSIQDWFWTAYTVATMTPGLSALQLQRQLGVHYQTAWFMLNRLRRGMVNNNRSLLSGVVEADEAIIGGLTRGKKGRTFSKHKSLVIGAVEVVNYIDKKGKEKQKAGRIRLTKIGNANKETIEDFLRKNLEPGTTVRTDGWKGYSNTALKKFHHIVQIQDSPADASRLAPHIHRMFSNLKTWLNGTHHGVDPKYLQNYLDEFVFRFNRRQTPMAAFQTLLGIASTKPYLSLENTKNVGVK